VRFPPNAVWEPLELAGDFLVAPPASVRPPLHFGAPQVPEAKRYTAQDAQTRPTRVHDERSRHLALPPPIEPYSTGKLQVSPVHEIYFEESGNPSGKPVIFLHGGPGGGSDPKQRRFFHPEKYRTVNFDQRGCGKSTPYASLEANTTWDLVTDIEKIREHLGIERWQVFGGSWGSTLALAYSQTHPDRVTELVLRGIFLLRKQEIDWFYQRGASILYPDAWEPYLTHIPEAERDDLLSAYYNPGRPKLPKGEAKGRIVPVRFTAERIKAVEAAARSSKQTVSEWVRSTIDATLGA
jgi:pimeloyl-ACP methyl ester carboxylesterase